ncbi:RNA 2'-phosphotransferase [Acaryochloris sp. IP29b_bin.137]|uniref:RNA 2'-phosphotransferase n=1 Tax=Acaryochloris sp. IP29b_bin.137 TaxID=2969217 RepID=UPI002617E37B|nr:RNA 2'-phosphotransferase [Acaryochloris sp. IP29b_bin.137]
MDKQLKSVSKFLSYVLRHRPDAIDLKLDSGGWANISELLQCAANHDHVLTEEIIRAVVVQNDKQRFRLSDDGQLIRANQGHSIPVDLDLQALNPPCPLFHGTAKRFLESIMARGLLPSGRQYVHLSTAYETAIAVGKRHGHPIILEIKAQQMHQDGFLFYRSENGVWLTEYVPANYLVEINKDIA